MGSFDRTIVYPPLTDDLQEGLNWRSLKYFGAGAIIASVTIASGETVFAARSGALFGYALLWCFVAGTLMKGIQVYSAARYMVLTGEHPMTHWGHLPGPKNWVPITIAALSLFCFPFWQAGLPMALGNIMNWIFGIQGPQDQLLLYSRGWATLAILTSMVLIWFESYAFLEKTQLIIVALLLGCIFAAVGAARPDWPAVLMGMFVPGVPAYKPWVAELYPSLAQRPIWVEVVTCIGAVGGGTYDYVGYVGCLREKTWGAVGLLHSKYDIATSVSVPMDIDTSDANVMRGHRWLAPVQIDTAIAFFAVAAFTICFVVLGARILHPQQLVPEGNDLFNHQAQFLTNLHPILLYVYQLGIFMAFFGTIYAAYEVYFRTVFECLVPISTRFRQIPFNSFRRGVLIYCATLGLVFLWTMQDPIKIVTPAAIVGGVFSCGLWCLLMLWTDRRFLPAPLRMSRLLQLLTAVSGVVLTLLGLVGMREYLAPLLVR